MAPGGRRGPWGPRVRGEQGVQGRGPSSRYGAAGSTWRRPTRPGVDSFDRLDSRLRMVLHGLCTTPGSGPRRGVAATSWVVQQGSPPSDSVEGPSRALGVRGEAGPPPGLGTGHRSRRSGPGPSPTTERARRSAFQLVARRAHREGPDPSIALTRTPSAPGAGGVPLFDVPLQRNEIPMRHVQSYPATEPATTERMAAGAGSDQFHTRRGVTWAMIVRNPEGCH
jgi:hypothetical protein